MSANDVAQPPPEWAQDALQMVGQRFGFEVQHRSLKLVVDALRAAAVDAGMKSERDCLALLRTLPTDAPLLQSFLSRITNNESYFFRDAPTMQSLRGTLLPELLDACRPSKTLRVWSAGCSSGEEIYTLSILLRELIDDYDTWNISLVATDVDKDVLRRARLARYKNWSLRSTSAADRAKYFVQASPGVFDLKERFRRGVNFMQHNLADPGATAPAPGRFDLILYRNVTIYFSTRAQRVAETTFRAALAPHGAWVSGPSDPSPKGEFETHVLPGLLYHRVGPRTLHLSMPSHTHAPPNLEASAPASVAPAAHPRPRMGVETIRLRPPGRPKPLQIGATHTAPSRSRCATPPSSVAAAQLDEAALSQLEALHGLADAGHLDAALRGLGPLLESHALVPDLYVFRAMLRQSNGHVAGLEGAEGDLTRAVYLDPGHFEAQLRLGLVLVQLGETDRARAVLRTAVSLPHGDDPSLEPLREAAALQLVRLVKEPVTR